MAAPFQIYRVLCSTPPELEPERVLAEATLTSFGATVTFPQQVLFAGASFRPGFDAVRHRAVGESNVRMCDFFLHIFSETWPGDAFQGFIDLAQVALADPSLPMRRTAVLFKNFAAADEKVRSFRNSLAAGGNCDLREFQDPAELERLLREIFASWWESVRPDPEGATAPASQPTASPTVAPLV
jgi:hypothetical protein